MMYGYGDHMNGWGYALGIITTVLLLAVLVVAILAAVRYLSRDRDQGLTPQPPASAPQPPTAEQLLAERFARGEIDADEYSQRLDTLRRGGRSTAAGTRS